jgi:hypothetical protein
LPEDTVLSHLQTTESSTSPTRQSKAADQSSTEEESSANNSKSNEGISTSWIIDALHSKDDIAQQAVAHQRKVINYLEMISKLTLNFMMIR